MTKRASGSLLLLALASSFGGCVGARHRTPTGVPQLHRYPADPMPTGTIIAAASAQQAVVPTVGVAESITGRIELALPYGFSVGSDGFGSAIVYSGFVRCRTPRWAMLSLSVEAAYERMAQTFVAFHYDDEAEWEERYIRQRLNVELVDVGGTLTFRPSEYFALSVGYGWQSGRQWGKRTCNAIVTQQYPPTVVGCDDNFVLPDGRSTRPRFETASVAMQFGWREVGAFISGAYNRIRPIGDVPWLWGDDLMLGFGFYARWELLERSEPPGD